MLRYLDHVEIQPVDMRSPQPAYLQLADQLRRRIAAMKPDEQIPSTYELVAQTGLAIGTVRKTVKLLIAEGLVYSVPGRGVFVR